MNVGSDVNLDWEINPITNSLSSLAIFTVAETTTTSHITDGMGYWGQLDY